MCTGKKTQYNRETMADIIRSLELSQVDKPESMKDKNNAILVRDEPVSGCQLGKPFPVYVEI